MAKLSVAEYDALTEDQQREHDASERQREAAEQAALPYKWRQTLSDLSITVPVPQGTRGKELQVELKKRRIHVGLKGKEAILKGELCKDIKEEDSTWTLEDQCEVSIHLEKVGRESWWDCVVQGGPKIDTTKIQPDNSKLSDLDGETRAMVEKMMFDNQQKQMGKPTSEELKKQEMLAKFQAAHPEMDFSNAKMT